MKITDSFVIDAEKDNVWSVFMDVEKLGSCVPGCKNLVAKSETEYEADMEVKTPFLKIVFKANGVLKDAIDGEELNVELIGKPLKLAGLFKTKLKIQLEEMDVVKTKVTYNMDLQMTGRLASLGDILMKRTVKRLTEEFAENVRSIFSYD